MFFKSTENYVTETCNVELMALAQTSIQVSIEFINLRNKMLFSSEAIFERKKYFDLWFSTSCIHDEKFYLPT